MSTISVRLKNRATKYQPVIQKKSMTQSARKIENIKLSKKFHYQCRYSSRNKSSPENIRNRDKPWPIFHKDLVCEIVCTVCKKSE